MPASGPNLFARLHKWAARQDENFLTESLAVVLEQLLILTPEVGTRLISRLTGGFVELSPGDAGSIEIRTQVETAQGRPDLEVSVTDRLVLVEVKAGSELRAGQLESYRVILRESGIRLTKLVLVTHYPEKFSPGEETPDLQLRWYDLADWVENELTALEASGEVAVFLARQFLGFLRERGMTLTQVGKYLPEGLRAFGNLLEMLFKTAEDFGVSAKLSVPRENIGIYLDGSKYWLGIYFTEPEKLCFGTQPKVVVDGDAAARVGITNGLYDAKWGSAWSHERDLDSEEVHFFSRNKVSQMRWLESFLRDCLEKAKSIEIPNQPPPPEAPEGEQAV